MKSERVTSDGESLINRWMKAKEKLRQAHSDLTRCECELSNSETALARWMLPEDIIDGEKISVWYGDSLIQVEKLKGMGSFEIKIRKRGKSLL